jgi:hypothetical protein
MAVNKLWTYDSKPNWVHPENNVEAEAAGWVQVSNGELLVCIRGLTQIRDDRASNLEIEDGNDFLLEGEDDDQPMFILL